MMAAAEYAMPALREPLSAPCYYPHYTFFMDYLGDVLLCPHDWGKKKIVGNMHKASFREIWFSENFKVPREMLATGNRKISPCNVCDAKGTLMGNSHVIAWNRLHGGGGG
jgi:radical SAM protein with 4Fe4S-binding SPASM domain